MATILPLLEALGSEMSLTILACRLLKLFREKLRSELGSPRVLMIVEYVGEGKVLTFVLSKVGVEEIAETLRR